MLMKKIAIFLLALASIPLASCKQPRATYPDIYPGWHNGDYSIIMGRLQRIPARDPSEAPTWIIRYGLTATDDSYNGELALSPPGALTGYSGGELVEIRGEVDPNFKSPNYPGTFYNIRRINIWNGSETR
jgi:hypothetical protein